MLSEMPRRGEILLRPPDGDAEVRKIAERHLAPLSACALGCAQDGRCSLPCVYGKRLLIDPQTILSSYSSFGSAPNPPKAVPVLLHPPPVQRSPRHEYESAARRPVSEAGGSMCIPEPRGRGCTIRALYSPPWTGVKWSLWPD